MTTALDGSTEARTNWSDRLASTTANYSYSQIGISRPFSLFLSSLYNCADEKSHKEMFSTTGSLVLKATTTASHYTNSFFLLTQINGMPDLETFFPNLTKRQNDETQTAELWLTEIFFSKPIFKKSNRSLKGYGFSFAAGINCGHLLVGGRFVRFRRQSHFWAASNYRCKI